MERRYQLLVLLVAALIYLGCVLSPPGLMDDVDAVQAQITANMLTSGDWVTARLNGVAYLEKSPLIYWSMAASFALFGIHDWAARLPLALSVIFLCWLTARFARWAFDELTGLYAGLILSTCIGLWLFTRIQIPDAMLTATIALALWAFLRAMEGESRWAYVMWAAMATGLLLKGLIAMVFPVGAILLWLTLTRNWPQWRKLSPLPGVAIIIGIAAPWHLAAALANPPFFDLTVKAFAYLRLPLLIAAGAFLVGTLGASLFRGRLLALSVAAMMILFFHAARLALITFDPYLGSRPLAEAYLQAPPGQLIVDNQYYTFSSIFFYTKNPQALLLNGRVNNLEYGSYAPGAPQVFIDNERFAELWKSPARHYLVIEAPALKNVQKWAGKQNLYLVKSSGGKLLYSNQ